MTINSSAQKFNEAEFSDRIIASFKAKSFDDFKRLLVDTTDYKEALSNYDQDNHISAYQNSLIKKQTKQFADSSEFLYHKEFDRLISKDEKIGVDWSQIKKLNLVFKEVKLFNSTKNFVSGHLNFTCKDKIFVIFGIQAVELSLGYKIAEIRTVLVSGVQEYVDPDLLDDDDI